MSVNVDIVLFSIIFCRFFLMTFIGEILAFQNTETFFREALRVFVKLFWVNASSKNNDRIRNYENIDWD